MPTLQQILAESRGGTPRQESRHRLAGLRDKLDALDRASVNLRGKVLAEYRANPSDKRAVSTAKRQRRDAEASLYRALDELHRAATPLGWSPPTDA